MLDEDALSSAMDADPDATLAMLADMAAATDPVLARLAREAAARLVLEVAAVGPAASRGIGRMSRVPYRPDAGDIDVDASLDAIVETRAGLPLDAGRLVATDWRAPATAWSVLVDRSGSMGGAPLATSAVAASAVALRAPQDHSVLAFSRDVIVLKSQDDAARPDKVVVDLLRLRGHGTTDLAAALRAVREQLGRSPARRRIALVLSDCRATEGADARAAARGARDEGIDVVIVAPDEDREEAEAFAAAVGARIAFVDGPSGVPGAIDAALGRLSG